jgi:hypothetical protein
MISPATTTHAYQNDTTRTDTNNSPHRVVAASRTHPQMPTPSCTRTIPLSLPSGQRYSSPPPIPKATHPSPNLGDSTRTRPFSLLRHQRVAHPRPLPQIEIPDESLDAVRVCFVRARSLGERKAFGCSCGCGSSWTGGFAFVVV